MTYTSIKEFVESRKTMITEIIEKNKLKVTLAIIQVGDNQASNAYIKGKKKDCEEVGIIARHIRLPENITEIELLRLIKKLNKKRSINGIIVQLPLPKHINESAVKLAVDPKKDVDGFHPLSTFVPGTPLGIVKYLEECQFKFDGSSAVVIGRSNIVGKPMYEQLLNRNCTVAQIHSHTPQETFHRLIENADLIVCATGKRGILDNSFTYKNTAVIIDVGMNRDENNKLCGDCTPELPVLYQSPVPGGVGLLTRLSLLMNTISAYQAQRRKYYGILY